MYIKGFCILFFAIVLKIPHRRTYLYDFAYYRPMYRLLINFVRMRVLMGHFAKFPSSLTVIIISLYNHAVCQELSLLDAK